MVDSVVVTLLMIPIAIYSSKFTDEIADPPKNAYYKKCSASMFDKKQQMLCEWVDQTIDYYNQKCDNCMKREGTYPITISWGNQSKDGTLGQAVQDKFDCKIELAINEDWIYDDGMKFRSTVLHEIGHCYGLDHESDPNSLMYPSHNPGFTEKDVLRFIDRLKNISQ